MSNLTPTLQQAGHHLRALREEQRLTQRDIILRSHGVLTNQQVSRIERGQIDKPPMQDLVLYGHILGLTPNEVAVLYGWWTASTPDEAAAAGEHPRLLQARRLLRTLGDPARSVLLHWLDFALAQAVAASAPTPPSGGDGLTPDDADDDDGLPAPAPPPRQATTTFP